MKHTLSLLAALVMSAGFLHGQTTVTLYTQPAASSVTGTDLGALLQGIGTTPVWHKWSITDQTTYWNSHLSFAPGTGPLTANSWQGTAISSTYGGTGLNSGSSTGWAYVSGGVWSIVTTISSASPMSAPHLVGNSAAPTKAAGTGAGTGPTITLDASANDLGGSLTVLTGTTPAGTAATIVTLTFSTAYATAPHVQLTAHSATAAALGTTTQVWVDSTTGTLVLKSGSAALTAATTYAWYYTVTQ